MQEPFSESWLFMTVVAHAISNNHTYSDWRIGITNDSDERNAFWGHPDTWLKWEADSEETARSIESRMINTHAMAGGVGGQIDPNKPVFVYIFLEAENPHENA